MTNEPPPHPPGTHAPPTTHVTHLAQPASGAWTLGVRPDPGVAIFDTGEGSAVTVVAGSDCRRLVRARLDPEEADGSPKSLIGVAERVRIRYAFSEAERLLVWTVFAHAHAPRLADESSATPACWFLRFDGRERFPKAVTMGPRGLASLRDLQGVFGPFMTKKQAMLSAESVTDALDLCRHHHLLVLAPDASACAYKDMGRCPAPCDGSESMASYRDRFVTGQRWLATPDTMRDEAKQAMLDASDSQDFERAAEHKTLLDRTRPLSSGAGAIVGRTWCVVGPDEKEGRVCVMHVGGDGSWSITNGAAPEEVPRLARDAPASDDTPPTELGCDLLGWAGAIAVTPEEKAIGKRAAMLIDNPSEGARIAREVLDRATRSAPVE